MIYNHEVNFLRVLAFLGHIQRSIKQRKNTLMASYITDLQ